MFTYEEAVQYIEDIPKFTKKNKLEHTRQCLDLLGSPDEGKKIIHVAGTNGKGSVCAFISTMLEEGGYKCGLFTSPHLVKINERFQINEVMVSDEIFLEAFCRVKKLADFLVEKGDYHPTYFEFLFLMGMLIFAKEEVDYIVLETGLGGRLDATNSVRKPLACVITSISLDHVEYLGNTIPEIAGEKAGIIKPGVPVVFDGNNPEAAEVIRTRADSLEFNYSGYMLGWIYCTNALYDVDPDAYEEVRSELSEEAEADLEANSRFWAKYDTPVAEVSDQINDSYLKANGQEDGVASYDRMVEMILTYYREEGHL